VVLPAAASRLTSGDVFATARRCAPSRGAREGAGDLDGEARLLQSVAPSGRHVPGRWRVVVAGFAALQGPTWGDLLFGLGLLILSNATEWRIHRNLLHRRRRPFQLLYDRHTPLHRFDPHLGRHTDVASATVRSRELSKVVPPAAMCEQLRS
jgi:hypothetical protein